MLNYYKEKFLRLTIWQRIILVFLVILIAGYLYDLAGNQVGWDFKGVVFTALVFFPWEVLLLTKDKNNNKK